MQGSAKVFFVLVVAAISTATAYFVIVPESNEPPPLVAAAPPTGAGDAAPADPGDETSTLESGVIRNPSLAGLEGRTGLPLRGFREDPSGAALNVHENRESSVSSDSEGGVMPLSEPSDDAASDAQPNDAHGELA